MAKKPNPLLAGLKAQQPVSPIHPAKVRKTDYIPCRQGKIGQTLHLHTDVHEMMTEIAKEQGTTMQALLIRGVNLVLQENGRKPVA